MGRLIDDLLTFSRMGRTEVKHLTVRLDRLIDDVRHDLQAESDGRAVEWHIQPLPDVLGDPDLLRLVFTNLVSNALKYTRGREPARIEIGAQPGAGKDVTLYVRDNGVGFDMRYVDKLFGVFQRLHHAHEFEGVGIGLANVRRIVHRHGGRTWAESDLGAGATFSFTLPAAQRAQAVAPGAVPLPAALSPVPTGGAVEHE
jgi:light-regulated signal transduction histidine kinase (bacteriophytochrome)